MTGTWMDKGERDEVDMAQFVRAQAVPLPDSRDARIAYLESQVDILAKIGASYCQAEERARERVAQLEAALQMICDDLGAYLEPMQSERRALRTIDAVLPRRPERDMRITQEELDA